jgi:hypothetical protein
LFISNRKGVSIEVPQAATRDQAFDALEQYRKDIQLSGKLLSGSETVHLEDLGRDTIKGHELGIPPCSKDELRKFILAYCDGQIWTDRECRGTDIGMVFMPLVMGVLSPSEEILDEAKKKFPPAPGEEPEYPNRPQAPEESTMPLTPERPPEPSWISEDPDRIADIQRKIKWQAANKADLDSYQVYVETQNQEIRDSYDVTLAAWEQECEKIWAQQESLEQEHQIALDHFEENAQAEWEAERIKIDQDHRKWMIVKERYEAARQGLYKQYTMSLGLVWEYMDQRLPQAINGNPMFLSCRLMNKADFQRALKAITRMMEHREEFKI